MSGLITSGDTVSNFGKLLPAVYIEQIYLNDGDDGAHLDVDLSIYVSISENTDITTLTSQIKGLSIFWFWASDSEGAGSVDINKLSNKEQHIWNLYWQAQHDISNPDANFYLSEISDESLVVYDDEGNRALKFSYSSKDEGFINYLNPDSTSWDSLGVDVYLFAFATFDVLDTSAGFWYNYNFAADSDLLDNRFGRLLTLETGDVAYDAVWLDGAPAYPEQIIWVDEDGNVFDGTPLQSLTSKYYSTDGLITHSEVVSSFEDLLGNYETAAESDDSLRDIMDQISLVLATHEESADILAQLNLIARVFPSKSTATNVGTLYIQYREKIATANAVIETGTEVFKEVITNTKVVDERATAAEYVSSATHDLYGDYEFDPNGAPASETYVTNMKLNPEWFSNSEETESWWKIYGFTFFDYDKALYETSDMGAYFDMDIVFNLLGKSFANGFFKLYTATYSRYNDDEKKLMHLKTTFDDGYMADNTIWYDRATLNGFDRAGEAEPYVYDTTEDNECWAQSFLLLRNFELGRTGGWDGYRMMCFEIQDIVKDSWNGDYATSFPASGTPTSDDQVGYDYVEFIVKILDSTAYLVKLLLDQYETLYASTGTGGLYEYYNEATTTANFNEEDDKWVSAYTTILEATYADNPGEAPWVLYPVYYCTFQALIGEIDGDMETVIAEANKISAKIHPAYGTVAQLTSFYTQFQALADTFDGILPVDSSEDPVYSATTKTYTETFSNEDLFFAGRFEEAYDLGVDEARTCNTPAYISTPPSGQAIIEYSGLAEKTSAGWWDSSWAEFTDGATGITMFSTEATRIRIVYDGYSAGGDKSLYVDGTLISDGDDAESYITVGGEYKLADASDPYLGLPYLKEAYFEIDDDSDQTAIYIAIDQVENGEEITVSLDFDGSVSDEAGLLLKDFEISFTIEEQEIIRWQDINLLR